MVRSAVASLRLVSQRRSGTRSTLRGILSSYSVWFVSTCDGSSKWPFVVVAQQFGLRLTFA